MANEFPCQRCGLEINKYSCTEPETGSWYGAQLCRLCASDTTRKTKLRKKKTTPRGMARLRYA